MLVQMFLSTCPVAVRGVQVISTVSCHVSGLTRETATCISRGRRRFSQRLELIFSVATVILYIMLYEDRRDGHGSNKSERSLICLTFRYCFLQGDSQ